VRISAYQSRQGQDRFQASSGCQARTAKTKGSESQHATSRIHLAVQPNPSFEARPNIKTPAPQGGAGYHPPCGAGVLLLASASIQTLDRMKPPEAISAGAQFALLAVAVLGLLALSLVVANNGFTHKGKGLAQSVFVPSSSAYLAAIPFFAMSVLALVALLRARKESFVGCLVASFAYILLGYGFYVLAR
jgi:hypothetical protein